MRKFRCHKKVEAAKVMAAERHDASGDWRCLCDDGVVWEIQGHNKITEEDLGYVVRYADGYTSWSPTKAFEEGYAAIERKAKLHFTTFDGDMLEVVTIKLPTDDTPDLSLYDSMTDSALFELKRRYQPPKVSDHAKKD